MAPAATAAAPAELVDDDGGDDDPLDSLDPFLLFALPILDQLFQSVHVRQGFPSGPKTIPGGS